MEKWELKEYEKKRVSISLTNKIFSGTLLRVRDETSTLLDKYDVPVLLANGAILSIHEMRGFENGNKKA